jgi:hypothetical protein
VIDRTSSWHLHKEGVPLMPARDNSKHCCVWNQTLLLANSRGRLLAQGSTSQRRNQGQQQFRKSRAMGACANANGAQDFERVTFDSRLWAPHQCGGRGRGSSCAADGARSCGWAPAATPSHSHPPSHCCTAAPRTSPARTALHVKPTKGEVTLACIVSPLEIEFSKQVCFATC